MNNTILQQFYENKVMREYMKSYFIETLKEIAVAQAMAGESTLGIKEANLAVEKSFDKLQQLYGKIPSSKIPNSR